VNVLLNLNEKQKEYLQRRIEKEASLLDTIKGKLTELERVQVTFDYEYEDGIYRFYHQSFKVYGLQDCTLNAVTVFRNIAETKGFTLCDWFEQTVTEGTGKEFRPEHNRDWPDHTRPIVEAFLHARYFLEMMVKYARELESPPDFLPFGWAAILELYGQR
jgi:hypothetical protein